MTQVAQSLRWLKRSQHMCITAAGGGAETPAAWQYSRSQPRLAGNLDTYASHRLGEDLKWRSQKDLAPFCTPLAPPSQEDQALWDLADTGPCSGVLPSFTLLMWSWAASLRISTSPGAAHRMLQPCATWHGSCTTPILSLWEQHKINGPKCSLAPWAQAALDSGAVDTAPHRLAAVIWQCTLALGEGRSCHEAMPTPAPQAYIPERGREPGAGETETHLGSSLGLWKGRKEWRGVSGQGFGFQSFWDQGDFCVLQKRMAWSRGVSTPPNWAFC